MLQYSDQELESAYQDLSSGRVKPHQLNDNALNQINNYISKRQMPDVAKSNAPASYFNGPASQLKSGGNAIQQLQNESEYRSKTFKPQSQKQSLSNAKPKENAMFNYPPYAPEATNKTYESMYKEYQKALADNTIYAGSAPKQAKVNPNAPRPTQEEIQQRLYDIGQRNQYEQLTKEAEQKRQENKNKGFLTNLEGRFGSALRAASIGSMYPIAKDGSGFDMNQLPKNVQEQILGQQYDTGSNVLNTTADIIGNLTSFGLPIGGASALSYANDITNLTKQLPYATGALGRMSGKVANQLAKSPKFVRTGLEQVPAGAFIGGVDVPFRNNISPINNPKEYAKSVAENVALGAGLGAGASVTASALKKIYNKLFAPKVEVLPPEAQLTLPPGQRSIGLPEGTSQRTSATTKENVFPAYSKNVKKVKTDEKIYSENKFIPSRGKVVNQVKELQQIYSKKLEDFRDYVLQKHGGQPNNHEVLLNDWSEFADKYDPDIETAFDWAYNPAVKSDKERIINAFGSIKNAKGAILRGRDYLQSREAAGVSSFVNKRPKPFINQAIDNLPTKEEPIPTQQPSEQATVKVPSISKFIPPVKEQSAPTIDQERALFDNKVKRFFGRDVNTSNFTTNELYDLSNQIDKQTSGVKQVNASSNRAMKTGEFNPYNVTYTTKNPQKNDILNEVNRIDDEISKLNFQMEQEVKMLIPLLKKEIGNKPTIVSEYDKVDGLVLPTGSGVRVSNNPEWYQQWAKKNDYRKPNNKDFEDIARSIVYEGKYYGGGESFQTKKALEDVKYELQSELKKINEENSKVSSPELKPINSLTSAERKTLDEYQQRIDSKDPNEQLDPSEKAEYAKLFQKSSSKTLDEVRKENKKNLADYRMSEETRMGIMAGPKQAKIVIEKGSPEMERVLNATDKIPNYIARKTKQSADFMINLIKDFKYRPDLTNGMREKFYHAEIKIKDAWDNARKDMEDIINFLPNRSYYETFRKIVVLRDLKESAETKLSSEQVKLAQDEIQKMQVQIELERMEKRPDKIKIARLENQIYTLNARVNPILPEGITKEEVIQQLNDYELKVKNVEPIQKALLAYENLMKAVANELVRRGKLSPESVRDSYYPHRVLDEAYNIQYFKNGLGTGELKTPYRFYTEERLGSKKTFDTDFEKIITQVLGKVYADNAIDDFAKAVVKDTDVLPSLKPSDFINVKEMEKINRAKTNESFANNKLLDGQTIQIGNDRYKFWQFDDSVHLIPENVYKELKTFKEPLTKNMLLRGANAITQPIKSTLLTTAGAAYQFMNLTSNLIKLSVIDPVSLKYARTAAKIIFTKDEISDNAILQLLNATGKNVLGKRTPFDKKVEEFALNNGILELNKSTGVYRFSPLWLKTLDKINVFKYNRNLSQKGDELFRLMKLSADCERIWNNKEPIHRGVINIEGLDAEQSVTKIAREIFVDPGKMSNTMRNTISQLLFPFINWPMVDAIHTVRYVKNNPKKAATLLLGIPAAIEVWNNTGDRKDIEENLPDNKRLVPHVITGYKDKNNKGIVVYLSGVPGISLFNMTNLNDVPSNVTDAVTNRKSISDSLGTVAENLLSSPIDTTENFLNPLLKTPIELFANKQMFNNRQIVSDQEEGNSKGTQKKIDYFMQSMFAPYRSAKTAVSQASSSEDIESPLKKAAINWINPFRSIYKKENIDQLKRNKFYSDLNDYQTNQDENRLNIIDQYAKTGNFESIKPLIKNSGFTSKQIEYLINSPAFRLARINYLIQQTNDPNEKSFLQEQKRLIQKLNDTKKVNSFPANVRSEEFQKLKGSQ